MASLNGDMQKATPGIENTLGEVILDDLNKQMEGLNIKIPKPEEEHHSSPDHHYSYQEIMKQLEELKPKSDSEEERTPLSLDELINKVNAYGDTFQNSGSDLEQSMHSLDALTKDTARTQEELIFPKPAPTQPPEYHPPPPPTIPPFQNEIHHQYQPASHNEYSPGRSEYNPGYEINYYEDEYQGSPLSMELKIGLIAIFSVAVFVFGFMFLKSMRWKKAGKRNLRIPRPTSPADTANNVNPAPIGFAIVPDVPVGPYSYPPREDPEHPRPSAPLMPNDPPSVGNQPPTYTEAVSILNESNRAHHDNSPHSQGANSTHHMTH